MTNGGRAEVLRDESSPISRNAALSILDSAAGR